MRFGWDISTSVVGVTVMTDLGAYHTSSFIDLRKLDPDVLTKALEFERAVVGMSRQHPGPSVHYVEERLGGFSVGHTMQQTLLKLAAFNSVCSYIIQREFRDGGTRVVHLHPSRVKSVLRKDGLVIPKGGDKKALTLQWVSEREPEFPVVMNRNGNPQPYCFDMADSYAVVRAGHLLGC